RGGKPMIDCVTSELKEVKDFSLIDFVGEHVENASIKSLYDTSTTRGQEEYKEEEKEEEEDKEQIPYVEIVNYLNDVADKKYRPSTQKTKDMIKARWNEGFRLDEFKKVIDIKSKEWKHDNYWNKFLRPQTLFSNKFEGYLNQESNTTDSQYDDLF